MPNAYIRNFLALGNGPAMSAIVEMLVSAGWTYQASGTGTNGIFSPPPTTVSISSGTPGIVSWSSHGLRPNVPVVFTTTGTLPPEITAGQTYYVAPTSSFGVNQFALTATPGGTAINTSASSTSTTTATVKKVFTTTPAQGNVITSSNQSGALIRISANGGPATVYWQGHGLLVGDCVRFDVNSPGGLPSGVNVGTNYFVISSGLTADTFQFSNGPGGGAINSTSGTGNGIMLASCPTSWGNANAWARLQDPSGTREFLFQHDNNTSLAFQASGAKIRYSASAKFTGTANGAVSATVPPTAADERYLRGTSSSYGVNWFPAGVTVGGTIFQGAALSSAPYGWWFACASKGNGIRYTGMMFDPVVSVAEDPDPYVIHIGAGQYEAFSMHSLVSGGLGFGGNSTSTWTIACGATTPGSFAYMDTSKSLFLYVQPLAYACTGSITSAGNLAVISGTTGATPITYNLGYTGLNTFNNIPDALPVAWARLGNPSALGSASQTLAAGLKGWSTLARWTTLNRTNFVDTMDNKNWICVGPFWLRWDGVTTPIG